MPAKKKSTPVAVSRRKGNPVEPIQEKKAVSPTASQDTSKINPEPRPVSVPPPVPISPVAATSSSVSQPIDQAWMFDPHLNDNMPPIQDTIITLLRTTTYQMPGTCPVCNQLRSGGKGKIHTTNSYQSGRMKYTLSLDFPICQKCTDIQEFFTKRSNKASLLAIPFGVLVLIVFILLAASNKSGDSGGYICGGIIAALVAWGIAYAIINAIINRNLPVPLKERNKRINPAVIISTFNPTHVSFKFKNNAYAAAFQLLNSLGGTNLVQQMMETLNKK